LGAVGRHTLPERARAKFKPRSRVFEYKVGIASPSLAERAFGTVLGMVQASWHDFFLISLVSASGEFFIGILPSK
jgi:hypothetical protein